MRIAIYGTGNRSRIFVQEIKDVDYCEVTYFVESKRTKEEFIGKPVIEAGYLDFNDFNYLIIAVEASREIIEYLKQIVPDYEQVKKKIIYEIDFYSLIPELRSRMPYNSCVLANGIKYVFSPQDRIIGESMLRTGMNFAENQIKAFFELTDKYYGKKSRNGYFLDVGANIGTTSIYVKKIINPNLKVLGIEAGKDNYTAFRMNCMANDVEDIRVVNVAVGDEIGFASFNQNINNPGGSNVSKVEGTPVATKEAVELITLDELCKREYINPESIDYLWIDVEGFEANVLKGATAILEKGIPLMQEFNPFVYEKRGLLDEYCEIMEKYYDFFIDYSQYAQGKEIKRPVSDIRELVEELRGKRMEQTDLVWVSEAKYERSNFSCG